MPNHCLPLDQSLTCYQDIVVGDIVTIGPGDPVACDGVLLTAHSMMCDESSITGEPEAIKKITFDDCMDLRTTGSDCDGSGIGGNDLNSADMNSDCFVISGSRVLEGEGKYVVVAVGTLSFSGRNMRSVYPNIYSGVFLNDMHTGLHTNREKPSLRLRLNSLLHVITRWAIIGALLLFTALMIRYFVWLGMGKLYILQRFSQEAADSIFSDKKMKRSPIL
jgi:Ca2+-transporting ATPase